MAKKDQSAEVIASHALEIVGTRDSYYRCDELHTRTGRTFAPGYFSDAQVQELINDPWIIVREVAPSQADETRP